MERINRKQRTRWQHLSRLKASAFFPLQIFLVVMKHSNLYLGLLLPSCGWQSLIEVVMFLFIFKIYRQFYTEEEERDCGVLAFQVPMLYNNTVMVILTLLILGLKNCSKFPQYLCLPPWANVIKLFIRVIYCHSMVFTAIRWYLLQY